ncbi:epimerase [Halioglobus japonicus]|uniref:Epimerase n=1 Tax=Halioglobus japonicus TaxID=930805 RepID=A0AAP8MGK6_9GAMM|nr:NAD-dependent epimerase/dehydratase family protein [Halioglobus japonicus]AQA19566.1 epimerase [Halioglobus japonicus]PLW87365.1 epimerase [Halioglobus japonicus]GHD08855.1 hypothetical protein GCM10007052_06220 [Halioglobus japonicus]
MNILIVGGTGLTGATTARHLSTKGHQITLMSRSAPSNPALAEFAHICADYIDSKIDVESLRGFDALIFAAGADIRMLPEGEDPAAFFHRANTEAIPRFFNCAKHAGIKRAAYLGTYYPQVTPEKIESDSYVQSRYRADKAIREMSDDDFSVCSVNPPFIIGTFPGVVDAHLAAMTQYAAGLIEGLTPISPDGGVFHITAQSLAEALEGALLRGVAGKAYLVGDEYWSWQEYIEAFCREAGNAQTLAVSRDEHPLLPDMIMYAGRNAEVRYTPENAPLDYSTGSIAAAIEAVVETYLPR